MSTSATAAFDRSSTQPRVMARTSIMTNTRPKSSLTHSAKPAVRPPPQVRSHDRRFLLRSIDAAKSTTLPITANCAGPSSITRLS